MLLEVMLTLLLLIWGVGGYIVWLWWLHQIDQREGGSFKCGAIIVGVAVGVVWPFLLTCYLVILILARIRTQTAHE